MSSVTVELEPECSTPIIMPSTSPYQSDVDPTFRWYNFYAALFCHRHGHGDMILRPEFAMMLADLKYIHG